MNLGELLYDRVVKGQYPIEDYLSLLLQQKGGKLPTFLLKEFAKKKCKFSKEKWDSTGRSILYYGNSNEWWLVDLSKIEPPFPKDKVDYMLPLNHNWVLVAVKH